MSRELTPVEVLTVLIERMEKRAEVLDGVGMESYKVAADELRNFARQAKDARSYLQRSTDATR